MRRLLPITQFKQCAYASSPLRVQRLRSPKSPLAVAQLRTFHRARWQYQQDHGANIAPDGVVHLYKPLLTWRRTSTFVIYTIGSYFFLKIVIGTLFTAFDLDSVEDEDTDENGKTAEEHEEESVFIPLQFPKKLPSTLYKQSDPDWIEFSRMSKDDRRSNAIKTELAIRCLNDVTRSPRVKALLGSKITLGPYWLDMRFPDGPPPEYERYGLEISNDFVSWSTQVIPHSQYLQVRNVLYPKALFNAVYNSVTLFSSLQLIKFKTAVGLPLNHWDKQTAAVSKIEKQHMEAARLQRDSQQNDNPGSGRGERQLDGSRDSGKASATSDATSKETNPPSPITSIPLLQFLLPPPVLELAKFNPSANEPGSSLSQPLNFIRQSADISMARKSFFVTLHLAWQRAHLDFQPKGAFWVVGQVEVRGEKGRIRCDIQAAYDPKGTPGDLNAPRGAGKGRIVYCMTKIRYFWPWVQTARGGP